MRLGSAIQGHGTGDNRPGRFETLRIAAAEDGWWRDEEVRAPAVRLRSPAYDAVFDSPLREYK